MLIAQWACAVGLDVHMQAWHAMLAKPWYTRELVQEPSRLQLGVKGRR